MRGGSGGGGAGSSEESTPAVQAGTGGTAAAAAVADMREKWAKAAEEGRFEDVCELLTKGADVNNVHRKKTALIYAAENGHEAVVEKLIEAGADLDFQHGISDFTERTALICAAENGHEAVVETLMRAGANLDLYAGNLSALHIAQKSGHKKIVEKLMLRGEDPVASGYFERLKQKKDVPELFKYEGAHGAITALMRAACQGDTVTVCLILDSKHCTSEYISMRDHSSCSALMLAGILGHTEVVKAILNSQHCTESLIHQVDDTRCNVLMLATIMGHTDVVEAILNSIHCSQAVLENCSSANGHVMVKPEALSMVSSTVIVAVNCLARSTGESNALMLATEMLAWGTENKEKSEKVQENAKKILESDYCSYTVISQIDEDGWTALMNAAHSGRAEIVKLILAFEGKNDTGIAKCEDILLTQAQYGGDLEFAESALMMVCDDPDYDNCKIGALKAIVAVKSCTEAVLCQKEGPTDPWYMDDDEEIDQEFSFERTALIRAVAYKNLQAVSAILAARNFSEKVLLVKDNEGDTALIYALKGGVKEIIQAILATEHCTAKVLQQVVEKGNPELFEAILAAGADVSKTDEDGKTLLIYAVENGKKEMVEVILAAESCTDVVFQHKDEDGKTALVHARAKSEIEALLQDASEVYSCAQQKEQGGGGGSSSTLDDIQIKAVTLGMGSEVKRICSGQALSGPRSKLDIARAGKRPSHQKIHLYFLKHLLSNHVPSNKDRDDDIAYMLDNLNHVCPKLLMDEWLKDNQLGAKIKEVIEGAIEQIKEHKLSPGEEKNGLEERVEKFIKKMRGRVDQLIAIERPVADEAFLVPLRMCAHKINNFFKLPAPASLRPKQEEASTSASSAGSSHKRPCIETPEDGDINLRAFNVVYRQMFPNLHILERLQAWLVNFQTQKSSGQSADIGSATNHGMSCGGGGN